MMVDQHDSPLWYALILRCQDMPGIITSASSFHAYEAYDPRLVRLIHFILDTFASDSMHVLGLRRRPVC